MAEKTKIKTSIGGSALIEGIMMRGPKHTNVAVRMNDDSIYCEEVEFSSIAGDMKFFKLPFVRGFVSLVDSMRLSMKCLTLSADKAMEGAADGIAKAAPALDKGTVWRSVLEGILKIAIFLGYIVIVSRTPDMKRTFMYHGAEHKTIFCYENLEELTVENVRKYTRFHPRCGTSFMIIMLLVGIIIGLFITARNPLLRALIKILLLPVSCGIGYELIKLCAKYDNVFTRIVAAPGLMAQRITTIEPDDSMIEVAIAAIKPVIPENGEDRI